VKLPRRLLKPCGNVHTTHTHRQRDGQTDGRTDRQVP